MIKIFLPRLEERLIVPAVSFRYPEIRLRYNLCGYEVNHTQKLVLSGRNHDYYYSKNKLPKEYRMSTAREELAIQMNYEKFENLLKRAMQDKKDMNVGINSVYAAKSILNSYTVDRREEEAIKYVLSVEGIDALIDNLYPKKAKVFENLFTRGWQKKMWQRTETFLRIPKGKDDPREPDYIDSKGQKYWLREIGNGSEIEDMIYVPEGNGRLVAEWNEVFGIPSVTIEDQEWPHDPYKTHFWFNTSPHLDDKSGYRDVAIWRINDRHPHVGETCLAVDASFSRLYTYSDISHVACGIGFRLVQELEIPDLFMS